jgi:hypothetical protein
MDEIAIKSSRSPLRVGCGDANEEPGEWRTALRRGLSITARLLKKQYDWLFPRIYARRIIALKSYTIHGMHTALRVSLSLADLKTSVARGEIG